MFIWNTSYYLDSFTKYLNKKNNKKMRFLYKLSIFVYNKIDFKPKIWELPTFGKGTQKLTAPV